MQRGAQTGQSGYTTNRSAPLASWPLSFCGKHARVCPEITRRANEGLEHGEEATTAGDAGNRHPAESGTGLDKAYPAVPESAGAIRASVAALARDAQAPQHVIDAVALASSEAATNVILHAYRDLPEPGCIHVAGRVTSGQLSVTITDHGSGLQPRRESPGLGLGLAIIARLADSFDLATAPTGGIQLQMHFRLEAPLPDERSG